MKDDRTRLLNFYVGIEPDDRGRFLGEILDWPNDELERNHDYIQWLFPTIQGSGFNVHAPILDANTVREFRTQTELRRNLIASFGRMLAFYGMEIHGTVLPKVTLAGSFAERAAEWVTPSNHNHLRITRILKSLQLLGLEAEATAFFDCLADIYYLESGKETPGISEESFNFWESAADRSRTA